jgi:hypothetical protein
MTRRDLICKLLKHRWSHRTAPAVEGTTWQNARRPSYYYEVVADVPSVHWVECERCGVRKFYPDPLADENGVITYPAADA